MIRMQLGAMVVVYSMFLALSPALPTHSRKTYPERGTVIDTYASRPLGEFHGGSSVRLPPPGYRVGTDTIVYEFDGHKNQTLAIGSTIEFRIDRGWAYVKQGDKEEKFHIAGTEPRPPKFYQ